MDRLIDYLFFVGPGRGSVFRRSPSLKRGSSSQNGGPVESITSWHKISRPVPTILCHFPPQRERTDCNLPLDVSYFCQPEGPCVQLSEPKMHIFMLTDTESNVRTYGICLSIPHLFDPLLKAQAPSSSVKKSAVWEVNDCESVAIQEWGVLSICILTRHPFYHFFAKCLKTLSHFVDHFGGKELNWNAIIQAQINVTKNLHVHNGTNGLSKGGIVQEVQDWITKLVSLKSPSPNVNVLELELEVDPAIMVCYPPPNRLPLFDLQVHKLFQKLEVCFVIDIYKLVLSEEKVILHSHDVAFVSECVLTIVTLLYPLQYLFPVIPLLPTSMPTAENLLMVPTPFFVGVCTSFMKKVNEVHRSETWIVDLDSKEIRSPSLPDKPPLEFPFSILQLQADIRRAMDKLDSQTEPKEEESKPTSQKPTTTDKSFPKGAPPSNHTSNSTHTATTTTTNGGPSLLAHFGDDVTARELEDDVDVMIRISFIEFLFSSEILGLIERHVCVFRLFPRPVVTLKQVAFLSAYEKTCSNTEKTFIKELILSQCVEYFQEWSLNPPDYAFDEIRKGTKELERLSDKQQYYVHRMGVRTDQTCLYNSSPDSLLYQEMLSFKASQASSFSVVTEGGLDDDSDWEILPEGDYYDGGSETSSATSPYPFYTNENSYSRPPYVLDTSQGSAHYDSSEADEDSDTYMDGRIRIRGTAAVQNSDDEIEIGFHSRGGTGNPPTVSRTGGQPTPTAYYETKKSPPSDGPTAVRNGVKGQHHGQERHPKRRKGSAGKRRKTTTDVSSKPTKTTPASYPASPARHVSYSVPNNLGFMRHFPLDDPERGTAGGGYFPSPRTIDEEIDIIPPSSSDEDEIHVDSASRSPRGGRARRPLWRYNFETPLLHVPPLSGSSSPIEFNSPTTSTPEAVKKTPSEVSGSGGGGKNNKTREEEVDGLFTSRNLGLTATAGQMQTSRTLENQIQDLVTKITEGQGLPWPKPAHLKRLASYEKTRVMLLRELEVKLGVRKPDEFVMASDPQIAHVATTRAVFKGLQDLLKYLLQCVEEELQRESEAAIFSVFLILRLAFSIHLPPPPTKQKAGGGGGGLSFFSALFGSEERPPRAVEMESFVGKSVEEYDGGKGKSDAERKEKEKVKENGDVKVVDVERRTSIEEERALKGVHEDKQAPSSLLGEGEQGHESPKHIPEVIGPLINLTPTGREDIPVRTIGSASSAFTPVSGVDNRLPSAHPVATPPSSLATPTSSLATPPSSLATPTTLGQLHRNLTNGEDHPDLGGRRVSLGLDKGSPLRKGRAVSPSHQLLLELLESPRIYRPKDEADCRLSGCVFLYKEVMKSLGSAKAFLLEKKFWDVLFMSTVSTDRNLLGWNEKTTELYTRYNTLHEDERREFGLEEDNLLSIVLHDLLVFMLMVGMGHEETAMLIHRFAARIRLATSEEKLLQQTLKYIEKNASTELDLSSMGLLTLYSEVHPTISYIVHYGISVVAPVYKLQLTCEAIILRRFPDEGITTRLWNDHVTEVECNQHRSTVTVRYKEHYGEYNHHFHTKQYENVCESLLKLIPRLCSR